MFLCLKPHRMRQTLPLAISLAILIHLLLAPPISRAAEPGTGSPLSLSRGQVREIATVT